jgi:hypothetical protein
MPHCPSRPRVVAPALAILTAWAACVSYDPTGPSARAINGVYAGEIVTILTNDLEVRHDTATSLTLALRDSAYRGRFDGYYRFPDGDSGGVDGTLYPGATGGRVKISHFGAWPPVAGVDHVRRFYPWCDFARLTPLYIEGELRGDTLFFEGHAPLPCSYQLNGSTVELQTTLEFRVIGGRQ